MLNNNLPAARLVTGVDAVDRPVSRSDKNQMQSMTTAKAEETGTLDISPALRFVDDYAEYVARADSGGSTYGLLKRHAFAQRSLRVRPTCSYLSPPSAESSEGTVGTGTSSKSGEINSKSRQRRSKSLVPPARPTIGWEGDSTGSNGLSLLEQKTILKALYEQTQKLQDEYRQQDQQALSSHTQIAGLGANVDYRRHSSAACFERCKTSLHPTETAFNSKWTDALAYTIPACIPVCLSTSIYGTASNTANKPTCSITNVAGDGAQLTCPGSAIAVPTYRRRSFSVTPKGGLVNEGDEVVDDPLGLMAAGSGCDTSRRSSYNSSGSGGCGQALSSGFTGQSGEQLAPIYRVLMLGGPGVGKTALTQQFLTSEFMAAQNTSFDDGREIAVPVLLDGESSVMEFIDLPYSGDLEVWREYDVDGYIIVYSITDRRSYQKAVDVMASMRADDFSQADEAVSHDGSGGTNSKSLKPVILVANKSDLERSRMIGKEEGKSLAHNHGCKYIEVSAILNHKVDDLLVGALKQIRIQHQQKQRGGRVLRSGCVVGRRGNSGTSCSNRANTGCGGDQSFVASLRAALIANCGAVDSRNADILREEPANGGCLSKVSVSNGILARLLKVGSAGRCGRTSRSCESLLTI